MRKMILLIIYSLKLHFSSFQKIQKSNKKLIKNYTGTKSTKIENKIKKIKKKYIYKSLKLPKRPGVAEAVHSALDASIYRLSNVGPYFNNCVVDP